MIYFDDLVRFIVYRKVDDVMLVSEFPTEKTATHVIIPTPLFNCIKSGECEIGESKLFLVLPTKSCLIVRQNSIVIYFNNKRLEFPYKYDDLYYISRRPMINHNI